MTCTHIRQAKTKMNNLIKNLNDRSSSSWKKSESFAWTSDIQALIDEFSELNRRDEDCWGPYAILFYDKVTKLKLFTLNSIKWDNDSPTYKSLEDIYDMLNNCDCYSNVSSTESDLNFYKTNYSDLQSKHSKVERELRNLRGEKDEEIKDLREKLEIEKRDRQNDKTGYNNKELEWEREKGRKNTESARKDEKITGLENQVQEKENQIGRLELRLDQRRVEARTLENQLTTLRLESGEKDGKLKEKDNELKKKNEEIKRLKKWAELSQEELLREKLRSEKENLKLLANELKISLEKINNLSRYHERLFQAHKVSNQANIATHEDNIARIEEELHNDEISMVHIQEICRKCQRIAELGWELEQVKKNQVQMNDWKNINSNFTLELVQEWIKHGFTIEQCREWINTNSPWQQNRAIKEPAYYAWLRDVKKVTVEWVLNQGNEQELGQEFFQWYQEQQQYQAHQEVPVNH